MSTAELSPRKPRRRLFAISVRALILLILVVAAGLGWIVNRAHVQRRAVARIEQARGSISYDYPFSLAGSSWAPGWLRNLEVTSIRYYLPAEAAAGAGASPVGDGVPLRSFRFPGANPNTVPSGGDHAKTNRPRIRVVWRGAPGGGCRRLDGG
jgi:hypothetical protein